MIYPTLTVEIWAKEGADLYAQAKYRKIRSERVCPVRLSFQLAPTTVRTDSSGSTGHAQEKNAQVVILALPNTKINRDTKLVIMGNALRVIESHPRFSVGGKLDHIELHCMAWTD
jgi:hypothetical protein